MAEPNESQTSPDSGVPTRQVRALFTAETVTVYQAYSPSIANPAVEAGRFVAPFQRDRTTWIKPSLLWMAYRSGWATKPDQECVLAIEITRAGFESALAQSCLSSFDADVYSSPDEWKAQLADSPVRIQWDPERSITLEPLPYRAIQIGVGGSAVKQYVDDWTVSITDITDHVQAIEHLVNAADLAGASALVPDERPYPLPADIANRIGATDG